MFKKLTNKNVCVAVFPPPLRSVPLLNLIHILDLLCSEVFLVSSKKSIEKSKSVSNFKLIEVSHNRSSNMLSRLLNYLLVQITMTLNLVSISTKVDFFLFFLGGETLLPSIFVLKLLRKKIIILLGGTPGGMNFDKTDSFLTHLNRLSEFSYGLADKLVVYSPKIIKDGNINKYRDKILIAHEHLIDFDHFTARKYTNNVFKKIGYIGRLNLEKGVLNFVRSIPKIVDEYNSITFLICGTGPLEGKINDYVDKKNLRGKVNLKGWIQHDSLPYYLHQIDLLVLPSFTEGLPNILLESMACGTPTLATAVGAVPTIIKDNETGFILDSNDPHFMAEKIIELLNEPYLLEKVSKNALEFVRKNFSEEATLVLWKKVIQTLMA